MSDTTTLVEISLNKREVSHPQWGTFVVSRPTNKVLSEIESIKTRQVNRDLQSKERVFDPETGEHKLVPAFLTNKLKRKILVDHGEWSQEDELEIEKAEDLYAEVCRELNDAGFVSVSDLFNNLAQIKEVLETKARKHKNSEELLALLEQVFVDEGIVVDQKEYIKIRNKIDKIFKDPDVGLLLSDLDQIHKQWGAYHRGVDAQVNMMVLKLREISLFSDTVEARAEAVERLAKVFYCTKTTEGKPAWPSRDASEDDDPNKISWLYSEIEKLQRLQAGETEEDLKRKDRFNFLFQSLNTIVQLGELRDQTESKNDGEQQENQPEDSIVLSA